MILVCAALAGAAVAPHALDEASRAIAAGRPEQARQMIDAAVKQGASGPSLDRVLADLAFADRNWPRALAGLKTVLADTPNDRHALEHAGIAALNAGSLDEAVRLLDRAAAQPGAGWRTWSARGVAADRSGDWAGADRAYARAEALSPGNPQVLNNRGWSLLLRGDWPGAVLALTQAAAASPGDKRIAANLDLARSAVAEALPGRRAGESGGDWAARLNDAGVAAWSRGDRQKAMAAFAQALEASDRWFDRAANNLALMDKAR